MASYPGSWIDLVVPDLLPRLPEDPYSGGSFLYVRDPPLLYSVGRNGRDDGGYNGDDIHIQQIYLGVDPQPR